MRHNGVSRDELAEFTLSKRTIVDEWLAGARPVPKFVKALIITAEEEHHIRLPGVTATDKLLQEVGLTRAKRKHKRRPTLRPIK